MYQPRRFSDLFGAVESAESDGPEAAFRNTPRRVTRTRAQLLRTRVAPTVVSVALLATSGAFAMNLKANEPATAAVPAPVREDDTASRDLSRELIEEAPADEMPTAPADNVTAENFVGGQWASAFGSAAGEKFAQADLKVHAQPNSSSDTIGSVKEAGKVAITDKVVDGYRQVTLDGKVGYVLSSLLGNAAPVKPEPKPEPKKAEAKAEKKAEPKKAEAKAEKKAEPKKAEAKAEKAAPKAEKKAEPKKAVAKAEKKAEPKKAAAAPQKETNLPAPGKSVLGLKPKAMVVYNAVTAKWSFSSIGGYRASNNRSNHGQGGAIDFMLTPGKDSAKGWAVANYVAANASAFQVDHIIFEQKIWTPYRPYWRHMENRGSITANHYDHVHVSVKL